MAVALLGLELKKGQTHHLGATGGHFFSVLAWKMWSFGWVCLVLCVMDRKKELLFCIFLIVWPLNFIRTIKEYGQDKTLQMYKIKF